MVVQQAEVELLPITINFQACAKKLFQCLIGNMGEVEKQGMKVLVEVVEILKIGTEFMAQLDFQERTVVLEAVLFG